jgi:hypothetical protein
MIRLSTNNKRGEKMRDCPFCDNKGKMFVTLPSGKRTIQKCKRCNGVAGGHKSLKEKREVRECKATQ